MKIDPSAVVMRPTRLNKAGTEIKFYTAWQFTSNASLNCVMNRTEVCMGTGEKKHCIDLLDKDGEIVDDVMITDDAFEYLRRTTKFKLEGVGADPI